MDPVTVKMPVRKGVTPHSAPTTVAHGTTSPEIGGGFTPGGTTTGPDGAGAATGATAGRAVRVGTMISAGAISGGSSGGGNGGTPSRGLNGAPNSGSMPPTGGTPTGDGV